MERMNSNDPWRWVARAGAVYVLVGAAFVAASFFDPALRWLDVVIVSDRAEITRSVRMYAAVMGAVVVGFGAMLGRVASAIERGPLAVGTALRDGVLLWFVVDTSASLLHGSWQNALFNVGSLALGLTPIAFALRSLRARAPTLQTPSA
jgi:hypothetical protein